MLCVHLKVYDEICKQGAINSTYDNALFYLRDGSRLQGLVCAHVDDFFLNGSQLFHTKIVNNLRTEFSLSKEFFSQMLFTGIEMSQTENYVEMHQQTYIDELQTVQLKCMSSNIPLDKHETCILKGLVGQLQWIAKLTRPDIAFDVCELSTKVKNATTTDIKRANKIILKVKAEPVTICLPNVDDVCNSSVTLL